MSIFILSTGVLIIQPVFARDLVGKSVLDGAAGFKMQYFKVPKSPDSFGIRGIFWGSKEYLAGRSRT
jgi:hypothetical protein